MSIRRRGPKPLDFTGIKFTPTKFTTANQKIAFAKHFCKFVMSDFQRSHFPSWFYVQLSNTFGHIAHYNIDGFYGEWFSSTERKVAWLTFTQTSWLAGLGSAEHTFCDVELELQRWIKDQNFLGTYELRLAHEVKEAELKLLAELKRKHPDGG